MPLTTPELCRMQSLATRTWSPGSRPHPGQVAWSARYAEDLPHGPVSFWARDGEDAAWGWAESEDWLEMCVDPRHEDLATEVIGWFLDWSPADVVRTMVLETEAHLLPALMAAGFEPEDLPWFTHHHLDLAALAPAPVAPGYTLRHVRAGESAERAACHRRAWTPPGGRSRVTAHAYSELMATPPYRHDLDWVAVDAEGEMVASCLVWLDEATGVALVEPVGCAPEHRRRGLAAAVSVAALSAARGRGARLGLVCPRGDADYPAPARLYRTIGFTPGARTVTLRRERRGLSRR